MPRWVFLLAVMLFALPLWAQERPRYGVWTDGRRVESLANPGTKAVALFFVASDCPISNRTFPEMKRLREEFQGRGIRFWFVYANAGERPEEAQRHQAAYDAGGDAVLDVTGELAEMSGARVTPEISVLVPDGASGWRPVYTGRIDDRYVQIGVERPQARVHFAENALNAVLSGRHVEAATGTPVGCSIVRPKIVSAGSSTR
jgi:hypothetical protein